MRNCLVAACGQPCGWAVHSRFQPVRRLFIVFKVLLGSVRFIHVGTYLCSDLSLVYPKSYTLVFRQYNRGLLIVMHLIHRLNNKDYMGYLMINNRRTVEGSL